MLPAHVDELLLTATAYNVGPIGVLGLKLLIESLCILNEIWPSVRLALNVIVQRLLLLLLESDASLHVHDSVIDVAHINKVIS
jgi:hypothetical protein